jgi:hypothetical protein
VNPLYPSEINAPSIEELCAAIIYNPETGQVSRRHASHVQPAGYVYRSVNAHGYPCFKLGRRTVLTHRAAFVFMLGRWPQMEVDHVNGSKADNRWVNLREATRSQQCANKRRVCGSSGFKGVHRYEGDRWVAKIKHNGRVRHLGIFTDPTLAHSAYVRAANEIFGEFARPN